MSAILKDSTPSPRLVSLDVFRGIAIASMILVNNPGSWDHIYPPLEHAEWHGCTPTDLVFPFFLFIVGVAMPFSLAKYTPENRPTPQVYTRIIRRGLILFALGLLLTLSTMLLDLLFKGIALDFSTIRIMGVLQRIGLAYIIAAFAVLKLPQRGLWIFAGVVLIAYWVAMQLIPVPGYGAGNLTAEGNLGGYIDSILLGKKHLYKGGPFDPEGLFSTLPSVVTVLIGYCTGLWLKKQPVKNQTSINLLIVGLAFLVIGKLSDFVFPINKALWTSSYVVYTAGWALLVLALCYQLIEVRGLTRWGFPLEVMGLNAIFLFVGSGLLGRLLMKTPIGNGTDAMSVKTWIYRNWFSAWAGDLNGSLFFAIANVILWWVILYAMYRRRWFLKI
ncbi:acyltransferase family protein [Cuspidothrix issatschenkoi]|uniref:acyltransferase family protein n=1 Tax=Cuspidothrix issatschenkoi TaxID=230752 RepID=UPI002AD3C578|nr:heparan-alpha-glucosaminide N-acetyltransferase domain-containing protein [Cuspidothrix issatschenkoi]